jgi:hypothetical protein
MKRLVTLILSLICLTAPQSISAESRTGFSVAGLPSLGYNSDEGLKYGANAALYNYADGSYKPYFYSLETDLFLMTGSGKKNAFLFFDSPHLIPRHRLSVELKYENDVSSPFYGVGSKTVFCEELTDESAQTFIDEDYYHFGREKFKFTTDLQRFLWEKRLRALLGLGVFQTDIAPNTALSLLQEQVPVGFKGGWTNYLRFGFVYDTRDNEPAPTRGAWSEVMVEVSNTIFGSDYDYSRVTLTDRRYYQIAKDLVYANRIVFETMGGDVPFYEMSSFASSFKREEGLGGAKSVRGIRRNRFIGKTKLFANLELRWTMFRFRAWNQNFSVATNLFADIGRVWDENPTLTLEDFQLARGGGLRIGWNQNFIVAVDMGNSDEVPLALYIGLGYLY